MFLEIFQFQLHSIVDRVCIANMPRGINNQVVAVVICWVAPLLGINNQVVAVVICWVAPLLGINNQVVAVVICWVAPLLRSAALFITFGYNVQRT